MKGYVYVLVSEKDGKTYVGSTNDFARRFQEHTTGKVAATRHRLPLTCFKLEDYETVEEARLRELFLKSRSGRREMMTWFAKC
ncbi:GIY-YIG nuclease family protein [Candidatus Falkowbacteria bacterium]|nr:GIY-YIG nuclease family protein [Candidatus Falkowbacteria bacterium]